MSVTRTWLDAEPHLLQRLRQALPDVVVMLEVDAPANTGELPVPCVLLRYTGYRTVSIQPRGQAAKLSASWQALVVDRLGTERDPSGPARARMADVCARVLAALVGHRLPGFPEPVALAEASGSFIEGGLLFHPCACSLDFVVVAQAAAPA